MALGNVVYTEMQREAMACAVVDTGTPPKRVVELAAAGELKLDGQALEPFTTNENTVRDRARILRRRRAGKIVGSIAKLPPRDALEVLRTRLVACAEQELRAQENRARGRRDLERLRQIGRLLREAAALPLPTDPRPAAPGQQDAPTGKVDGKTAGGMAHAILQAHQRVSTQEETATDAPSQTDTDGASGVDVPRFNAEDGSAEGAEVHGSPERAELSERGGALAGAGRS